MAWLSKLANVALWPVKVAKLTVVYISRPFVSSALLVARSIVTIVAPGSGDSTPSHAAKLTDAPTAETVIPDTGAASDDASQQLGLGVWAWGMWEGAGLALYLILTNHVPYNTR